MTDLNLAADVEMIALELVERSKADPIDTAAKLGVTWSDAMDREWTKRYKRCESCLKWMVRGEFPFCQECNAW